MERDRVREIAGLTDEDVDLSPAEASEAMQLLYGELRQIAHRQLRRAGGNPTMHTTAIVNEAYIKLSRNGGEVANREHFLAIAAKAMRQIIIDYARTRNAEKRGGDATRVSLDEQDVGVDLQADRVLAIDAALEKLSKEQPQLAHVFECKFFVGMSDEEVAQALGLAKRTAQRDWLKARAYLAEMLSPDI